VQILSSKLTEELKRQIQKEIADNLQVDPNKILVNSIDISIDTVSLNLSEIEKMTLIKALTVTSGNISKTSSLLGITRRTVYSLIKKYSIDKYLNTCVK
jgi:two-component system, NtrC family, response regulator